MDKKRMAKRLIGGVAYAVVAIKIQAVIRKSINKQPNKDIAIQLSNTFWVILYILYEHYCIEEKE